MIVSAHFGTAFTRLPLIWRFIGPHRSQPFSHAVFLFLSSQVKQSKNHQSGLFPPSVKLQKWDVEIHGWIKWLFSFAKKNDLHPSIHLLYSLSRHQWFTDTWELFVCKRAGRSTPIRDVRLATRSINNRRLRIVPKPYCTSISNQ